MHTADLNAIAIAIQTRTPTFLWGQPGSGKTAVLEAIAKGLGEPLWTVLLSIREPQDLGGLPVIEKGSVRLCPPMWARELVAQQHGIVFLDEFNTAPPTTQSAALRVIYGGYAGDEKLPEDTSFVMAGNRAADSAGGYDLTAAIANRALHFDWKVDPAAWREGMVTGWPEIAVKRLPAKWRNHVNSKMGLVAAFIQIKPNLLSGMPQDYAEQGKAWPSGRTWDYVARLLGACESVGLGPKSEEARLLLKAAIGEGTTAEFHSWLVNLDLPDPEKVLAEPLKTDLPQRQDQILALLDAVTAAALSREKSEKERDKRYRQAWKFIGRLCDMGKPDLVVPSAHTLAINMPPNVDKDLPPETEKVLGILKKANINYSRT